MAIRRLLYSLKRRLSVSFYLEKKFFLNMILYKRPIIKRQLSDPFSIPVIIISFNQLYYLKKLVDSLLSKGCTHIVIVDNKSTYPPLLDYYKKINDRVTIEYMDKNWGYLVFFENRELHSKYAQGFYFLTDPDIVPNDNLPENFAKIMLEILLDNYDSVTKVGWALDVKSIPDHYSLKESVLKWEAKYWEQPLLCPHVREAYIADIDTTFAIYKPSFRKGNHNFISFYSAIRLAGNYLSQHGGWYVNKDNLTDEQQYYLHSADSSSSWKMDLEGNLDNNFYKDQYK